jgi:secondary thiamine-phosphate synthase enzyme
MLFTVSIATRQRTELLDITSQVIDKIRGSTIKDGVCLVYVPHTTAGITINENAADPTVRSDILMELNKRIPFEDGYRHLEGNSAAHIKASIMGCCVSIPVENGDPVLGTWQGIYLCEFDGPRTRRVHVKVLGNAAA